MLGQGMAELLPATNLEDVVVFPNPKDPFHPIVKTFPAGEGKKVVEEYRKRAFESLKSSFGMSFWIFFILMFIWIVIDYFIYTEINPVIKAAKIIAGTIWMAVLLFFIGMVISLKQMPNPLVRRQFLNIPKLLIDNSNKKQAPFVDATGLHEGALLGDVLHDPFQCFREGNVVFVVKDNKILPVEIKEFVNGLLKKYNDKILKKTEGDILIEAVYLEEPIYILGFKDGKIKPVRVLSVNRRVGEQEVLNINSGDVWISVTPEHKIFTKSLEKVEAGNISSDIFFRAFDDIVILTEEDVVRTYGKKEMEKYKQYFKWLGFKRDNPKVGWKKASRILGVPASRTRWWERGMKPYSLKVVERLKELNLLPLRLSDERLKIVARILGALFGDGNIDRRMNCLSFISSERDAILNFVEDLQKLFGNFSYDVRKTGEFGEAYLFRTTDRRIIRFFVALGAPVDRKSDIVIKIPRWIFLRRDLLISFLDGWFSSDGSVPKYIKSGSRHKLGNTIEISLVNRNKETVEEIEKFVKYLKLLGINAKVRVDLYRKEMHLIRIMISQSLENVIRLFSMLDLRYSPRKRSKFEEAILGFVHDINEVRYKNVRQAVLLLRKQDHFYKVRELVSETFNVTTETGNLIVNGILVKNSGGLETPAHLRVIPGAIHKAHKGVLFIDEIGTLRPEMQIALLTAMQEKKFPITGRSERSAGAMVQTDPVPCDFILVAAGTPETIQMLHPALRSRIRGYGYEVFMNSEMEDNPENRKKLARFVAQEVKKRGLLHFKRDAVIEIIKEARRMAGRRGYLTLRLRELGGLVQAASDIASRKGKKYVEAEDVIEAKKYSKTLERQIVEKITDVKKEYQIIINKGEIIGRVNGLAVFSAGREWGAGIVLPIEASVVPSMEKGRGKIIATGKLGEIAKEAIQNVSAIIKRVSDKDLSNYDIHIQFLQSYEGVEGDSASISVATAVLSSLFKIPVRQDTAMTGSLSIRGEVLPVGGINEKIEAAYEAGIKRVIIPESNMKDVLLNEKILKEVEIIPVKDIFDVLESAFVLDKRAKALIKEMRNRLMEEL